MKEFDTLIEGAFKSKQVKPKFDLVSLVENVLDQYYESTFTPSEPKQKLEEQETTQFERGREFVLSLPKFLRISLYLCSGILMSPLFLSISLRIAPRILFDKNDLIVFSGSSESASICLSSLATALHKPK